MKRAVELLETQTGREREVTRGRLSKQIAFGLGISEVTVKLHRANAMRKMQAASIGELIRTWELLPAILRGAPASQIQLRPLAPLDRQSKPAGGGAGGRR